jgi:hypothetical protein
LQLKELSLDEAMIPWRGLLKFGMYNPGKITKYGVLVRMVYEAVSGYICEMKIYTTEGRNLEVIFRQKLRPESSHLSSHFCNSVRLAETLLEGRARLLAL